MFNNLKKQYKDAIIRHWRRGMHERLMTIHTSADPTEVLKEDPREHEFLANIEQNMAGLPGFDDQDPSPTISPPLLDGSKEVFYWIQNPALPKSK